MARFYWEKSLASGQELLVPTHLVQHMYALRIRIHETIELFNGRGDCYLATISNITRQSIIVKIGEKITATSNNPSITIDLAISIIANNKMDIVLQKATELGVASIIPIISQHTQHKDSDAFAKKIARWQSIIISSCEQCGQNVLPQLQPIISLNQLLTNANEYTHKIILSPAASIIDGTMHKHNDTTTRILLVVGPEGGFTSEEVNSAIKHAFLPVKLGNLIMRSETAVIAGITAIYSKYATDWVSAI